MKEVFNITTHKAGEERIINGEKIILIEYNSYKDCKVLLSDGIIQHCDYRSFKNRKIPYSISTHAKNIANAQLINRVGEKRIVDGKEISIIRYSNNHDIDILLADGHIVKNTRYDNFLNLKNSTIEDKVNKMSLSGKKNKGIARPSNKLKYNIAILDSICVDCCGRLKSSYISWFCMLKRSYDKKYKIEHNTYKDVTCCDEWNKYSNFEKWYDENYWECGEEKMSLDKDILIKGNKIYSPDTCIIVPQRINALFTKNDYNRNMFIGVYKDKKCKSRYVSKISKNGKFEWIGRFNTPEDAFYAYKEAKENYVKQVANEYKQKYPNFPHKLYDAMYKYNVEITD